MSRSLAYEPQYALNAICPYFTMFPLEYPLRVLKRFKTKTHTVIDPFCGRGTTLFAARALGIQAYGIDASPVAVAIARAKLCELNETKVIKLAQHFIDTVTPNSLPHSTFFRSAFHADVLVKICSIREGLMAVSRNTDSSVLLRALMLGCLHGPMTKYIESQSYFSNQMPRTFASKPDYSVRFWNTHNLTPRNVSIIDVLKRKLMRIDNTQIRKGFNFTNVSLGDAQQIGSYSIPARNASLVITSPPYYGMKTYVEDQWLRNWFLGGSDTVEYGTGKQLDHTGQIEFTESLGKVWKNLAGSDSDELRMFVRFGIIPSAKVNAKNLLLASLEASGKDWQIVSTRQASTADAGKRQASQMTAKSSASLEYDFHLVRI